MVSCVIDDKALTVEEGTTILEAALEEGIKIPTLCWHKDLEPYGACRLCLVEIVEGGRPGLEASCVYKVSEGLQVKTDTDRVKRTRKVMCELLLARAPNSKKVKELAAEHGVTETRITLTAKGDCIQCGRCVRACAEISQRFAKGFSGRGTRRSVQTPFDKLSDKCIGCGACACVCPLERLRIEEAD